MYYVFSTSKFKAASAFLGNDGHQANAFLRRRPFHSSPVMLGQFTMQALDRIEDLSLGLHTASDALLLG
jgi:hypothetical protein